MNGDRREENIVSNEFQIAVEAISNIRTVVQLTKEQHFGDEYCRLLDIPYR